MCGVDAREYEWYNLGQQFVQQLPMFWAIPLLQKGVNI